MSSAARLISHQHSVQIACWPPSQASHPTQHSHHTVVRSVLCHAQPAAQVSSIKARQRQCGAPVQHSSLCTCVMGPAHPLPPPCCRLMLAQRQLQSASAPGQRAQPQARPNESHRSQGRHPAGQGITRVVGIHTSRHIDSQAVQKNSRIRNSVSSSMVAAACCSGSSPVPPPASHQPGTEATLTCLNPCNCT